MTLNGTKKVSKKVSVNGIDIFLLEARDAAWFASYEWNPGAIYHLKCIFKDEFDCGRQWQRLLEDGV